MKLKNPGTLSMRGNNVVRVHGKDHNVVASKPPKARFKPGDRFHYDGEIWRIVYMYRVVNEPGIWFHELESEAKAPSELGAIIEHGLGAGSTTKRIVYEAFKSHSDATIYFRDIYCHGDRSTKNTQELLKLKKV